MTRRDGPRGGDSREIGLKDIVVPVTWLVPTFGTLLFSGSLAIGLFASRLFSGDGDVGRHLRVGHDILASGRVAGIDVYSHTMSGREFVPYEWLSEVLFAVSDRIAGLPGVAVLSGLLFASATWVAYRLARLGGNGPILATLIAVLVLVLQGMHLLPRPHLFTTLAAVVFLYVLELTRQRGEIRPLTALPVVMWAWANLHGGFLVGFVLLGVYVLDAAFSGAGSRRRLGYLLLIAAACIVVSMFTPAGLSLWAHTTGYLRIDFLVDHTAEYRSPDFHATYAQRFLVVFFLGIVLLATGRARCSFTESSLFLGWLAAALHSGRNIPLFGVLAVPWYAGWTRRMLETSKGESRLLSRASRRLLTLDRELAETERRLKPWILGSIIPAALVALAVTSESYRYQFDPGVFPVSALESVDKGGPHRRVFNDLRWGGYLLYARPDLPVFIDGQTDFYGAELTMDYVAIMSGKPRWQEKLDEYGVGWTLTPPGATLVQLLEASGGWTRLYGDSVAVVMVRGPSQNESAW